MASADFHGHQRNIEITCTQYIKTDTGIGQAIYKFVLSDYNIVVGSLRVKFD